jgi:hypothetical protein
MTKRSNEESKHQQAVIRWAYHTRLPLAGDVTPGEKIGDYLFAIPNGGARDAVTGSILKAEGVKSGVSDLMLPLLRKGYAGLWLELKTKAGRPTPEQLAWQAKMRRAGYRAEIVVEWTAAVAELADYCGVQGLVKLPEPKGMTCSAC